MRYLHRCRIANCETKLAFYRLLGRQVQLFNRDGAGLRTFSISPVSLCLWKSFSTSSCW